MLSTYLFFAYNMYYSMTDTLRGDLSLIRTTFYLITKLFYYMLNSVHEMHLPNATYIHTYIHTLFHAIEPDTHTYILSQILKLFRWPIKYVTWYKYVELMRLGTRLQRTVRSITNKSCVQLRVTFIISSTSIKLSILCWK